MCLRPQPANKIPCPNMKKLVIIRRISQAFFFALFLYILWSTTYSLGGILPPDAFFKIDPLIAIFTSISERIILPGIWLAVVMLILTLVLGRFFCGWACPLGTLIDLCGNIRKKKIDLSEAKNKKLRSIKYYILAVIALFSFFGIQIAWVADPTVIATRFISLNFIPFVTSGFDKAFIFLIKHLNFYGPVYDFYRSLKTSFLGMHMYYFSHSGIILIFFVFICALSIVTKRLWCRAICPLGSLYALIARFSMLSREVKECTGCLRCKNYCRMAAIKKDFSYIKEECVLCMDCIYDCPTKGTKFTLPLSKKDCKKTNKGLSRREFIFLALFSFLSLGFMNRRKDIGTGNVIRPPAALKEEEFLNRCVRCGNCMRVCITNGLQPVIFESGIMGIWTPQLVPEIGYCEYDCTLCGNACPTGAIQPLSLEDKRSVRLGLAKIDRSICIAWAKDTECIVCQEHCPVPQKAIKLKEYISGSRVVLKPYVDENACVGCGICQNKCPVRPVRAIRVLSTNIKRA
jgi:MauM/NapG family ferredoxin protein